MAQAPLPIYYNQLLLALSAADIGLLRPNLERVTTPIRLALESPNTPIKFAYFMESGFASVVASVSQKSVEVGLIGREGMTALAVVFGNHRSPHSTYVQAAGQAQRIDVGRLRKSMDASDSMQKLFLKFARVFMLQTAHTAIANAYGTIEQRLARWILMAHDRIQSSQLPLTHEFVALMLAVRRAGVTDALHMLEGRGLIKTSRGRVAVLNRAGIVRLAGDLYGTPEAEYRRLIG